MKEYFLEIREVLTLDSKWSFNMFPMVWPPDPHCKSDGEKELFETLCGLRGENDALLANLRFTDSQNGDIEVDIVHLIEG